MLFKHSSMWDGRLGKFAATEHRIELKGDINPVRNNLYRSDHRESEFQKGVIDKMLKDRVIELTNYEWASPYLHGPQKTGRSSSGSITGVQTRLLSATRIRCLEWELRRQLQVIYRIHHVGCQLDILSCSCAKRTKRKPRSVRASACLNLNECRSDYQTLHLIPTILARYPRTVKLEVLLSVPGLCHRFFRRLGAKIQKRRIRVERFKKSGNID